MPKPLAEVSPSQMAGNFRPQQYTGDRVTRRAMKLQPFAVRNSLFILVGVLALAGVRASGQTKPDSSATAQSVAIPARITQAIDETRLVQLKGNVHPLARGDSDLGVAPANLPMERMLLMLKRSPEQESALEQLMADQYNTASPIFIWLTPEQFDHVRARE
jgi:hypothetical protein